MLHVPSMGENAQNPHSGRFYRVIVQDSRRMYWAERLPELIWIADRALLPNEETEAEIWGEELGTRNRIPLRDLQGDWLLDWETVANSIRREHYHGGLEPTLEMKLPFNYSRIPTWIKKFARDVLMKLRGKQHSAHRIDFPSSFAVDQIQDLVTPTTSSFWPVDYKSALVVTFDVDTSWLLTRRKWIDRFLAILKERGIFAAWYCVPQASGSTKAIRGIEYLLESGQEIGCHGFNHDAKWPLLQGKEFEARLKVVERFVQRWGVRGFRSEWLWRTPGFMTALSEFFQYDTSIPSSSRSFTSRSRNGCATLFPFIYEKEMVEIPLTLPMDEDRHSVSQSLNEFWIHQIARAKTIYEKGGLIHLSFHPQPHQAANFESLRVFEMSLDAICSWGNIWLALPCEVAKWTNTK